MRVSKQLEKPLRQVVSLLEKKHIRYSLIGGVALAQWGAARATMDLDFKILVPQHDYSAMRDVLREAFPEIARPQLSREKLIVAVNLNGIIVGFLLALPGYDELIVTRAVRRRLNGWSAWISTAEDLIIQKAVANRGRDWSDIEMLLLAQRGKLDELYIENWLSQFAELLEEPQILGGYKERLRKSKAA